MYKLLSRRTYTTYVTTASNTSLLLLQNTIRELQDRQRRHNVTSMGRRKAVSITYSKSVFVALSIDHAMRRIVTCPARLYNIFSHVL
jgi:hypothetical protein